MKARHRLSGVLLLVGGAAVWAGERPDERVLWQLFHAGRIELLNRAVGEYRRQYPGWKPPETLVRALKPKVQAAAGGRRSPVLEKIGAAIGRRDWPSLIRLAESHPSFFGCSRFGHLKALALARARLGQGTEAARLYRGLLACAGAERREVLAEALWALPEAEFHRLLDAVRASIPAADFADFDYRVRRKALWAALRRRDAARIERLAAGLAEEAVARRDLDLLTSVAWHWQRRKRWAAAGEWFLQALRLAPDEPDLARGALTAFMRLQRDEQVVAVARAYGGRHRALRKDAAAYLLGRAWDLFERGNFSLSRRYAQLAGSWLENGSSAEYLLAWLDLETGKYREAQRRFAALHRRRSENSDYGRGLVASHLRAGEDPERLARAFAGDPLLVEILAPHRGRQSYFRKQFLRAWRLDPGFQPRLENIASPYVGVAGLYRYKSGRSGLDRLQTWITPMLTGHYSAGLHRFELRAGFQLLRSGKLQGSGIRTLQASEETLSPARLRVLETEARRLRSGPPDHQARTALVEFSWRREGPYNPYFSLGMTPLGGVLAPRPTFRLGAGDWLKMPRSPWRLRWNGEVSSQPVRQSLLSYAGWKMLGKRWGRVLKSGVGLTGLLQYGDSGWNIYQSMEVAFLDGTGTKDNWMAGYSLAPGYDFGWRGFDYFTLGPYFNFFHYGNNQNHFRPGHGGYFSPQEFYGGGLQLGMLSEEGRKFIFEGRVALGLQHFHEARAPWYPAGCVAEQALCGADPDYPENRETSFAPSVRLRFAWRLHPHWQLVGGFYGQRTSGYEEFGGGLTLRWLFEPRPAVFSSDLPRYLFGILQ